MQYRPYFVRCRPYFGVVVLSLFFLFSWILCCVIIILNYLIKVTSLTDCRSSMFWQQSATYMHSRSVLRFSGSVYSVPFIGLCCFWRIGNKLWGESAPRYNCLCEASLYDLLAGACRAVGFAIHTEAKRAPCFVFGVHVHALWSCRACFARPRYTVVHRAASCMI